MLVFVLRLSVPHTEQEIKYVLVRVVDKVLNLSVCLFICWCWVCLCLSYGSVRKESVPYVEQENKYVLLRVFDKLLNLCLFAYIYKYNCLCWDMLVFVLWQRAQSVPHFKQENKYVLLKDIFLIGIEIMSRRSITVLLQEFLIRYCICLFADLFACVGPPRYGPLQLTGRNTSSICLSCVGLF